MVIKVGDRLPDCQVWQPGGTETSRPMSVNIRHVLSGRCCILFAVPGPFSVGCSKIHFPGFLRASERMKQRGVDTIACVSTADVFVHDSWSKEQGNKGEIVMVSDGNGTLTSLMGMEMDASSMGMGIRSKRYAMLIRDGIVAGLWVDESGLVKESSADNVLSKL